MAGLAFLRGVELGEPLENLAETEKLLNTPLDFVPASLHNLPGLDDFYCLNYEEWDIPRLIDQYFANLLCMARWGRFDSLTHLTYPFRYLPPSWRDGGYSRWQDRIDAVLSALAEKGLALEINVSGLREAMNRTLPDLPILRRFRELGGEWVTVGSDAHRPQGTWGSISGTGCCSPGRRASGTTPCLSAATLKPILWNRFNTAHLFRFFRRTR